MNAIVFMGAYYGACIYALWKGGLAAQVKNLYVKLSVAHKVTAVLVILSGIVLTVYWTHQNQFIYYWDYGGYWRMSIQRMEYLFSHNYLESMVSFFASVNQDDYNCFLPSVIAMALKIFGCGFPTYVLINHVLFLLPAVFVQALCVGKLAAGSGREQGRIFLIALAAGVLFPANYYAMYLGYIDVGILLPVSAAMYLLIGFDFEKVDVSRDASLGLVLVVVWICRRYTAFFIIGYVAALAVKACDLLWKKRTLRTLGRIAGHFGVIGGVSVGVLLIFFNQFFIHALSTDYGEMYSAYDAPFFEKLRELTGAFGAVTLITVAVAGILCVVTRRNRLELVSFMTLVVVETAAFWQTQAMGVHHRMLVNVPLFLCCMLVWTVPIGEGNWSQSWKRMAGNVAAGLCTLALTVNFCAAMLPLPLSSLAGGFFSERYRPLRRGDIDQLEELAEYLNGETAGTEKKIYIAASGAVLNHDILRRLYAPETMNAVPNMLVTSDVDLRDGFQPAFLEAEYVVVTAPIQLHLASGQELVRYPAELIQDGRSYMGRHFQEVKRFELDGGVTAKVYRKVSDWEQSDLEQMRGYFDGLYPGHEDLFGGRIP